MKRKVKRLAGAGHASYTFDAHIGWKNDSRERGKELIDAVSQQTLPSGTHRPPDLNPLQRFYHRWFHDSEIEYHNWMKERLTREGCYDEGQNNP